MSARRQRVVSARERGSIQRLDVRRLGDESTYLYRLIETIGSGPDLETILRGVVLLLMEATECHACLVWFVQDNRLVLRAATPPYAHLAGSVDMGLDEGLAGWVLRTRRSAFIEERALEDPRVKYLPELEEEQFQSLVSVPIFARQGEVLGVIALDAEAPHEFGRPDLDLLEHTASLIGGAVENARLYEDATARVAMLSELSRLSQTIASSATEQDVLSVVREGVRRLIGATRLDIHLATSDGELPEVAWATEAAPEPIVEPLIAGDDRLGVIAVSLPGRTPGARAALAAVAAHAAVAITRHRAIAKLTEENLVKDLFRALARPDGSPDTVLELARRLGCDLDGPRLVVHATGWAAAGRRPGRAPRTRPWAEIASRVEALLTERFPGVLLDCQERTLRALIPAAELPIEAMLGRLHEIDWRSVGGGLSVGVSNPCLDHPSIAHGFEEAEAAAEVGELLRGAPGVTAFDDLGPYRYVLGAQDDARDAAQQRLRRVVEYDRRRGTQLLHTLESYLDHHGSVTTTSRDLFIHTNTLRQRLDRIERLSGIDLERDDWLSLAIATKVVKLREMRRSAIPEGGSDG